jgi:mediator of RNA polymerase II transcription subunit 11
MAKDKPSQKQVDVHANHFLKTLNHVEMDLSTHINYLTQVSTGQAHEGSSYASQKTLQMAWHRSSHARSKVAELDRTKSQLLPSVVNYLNHFDSSCI